MGTIIITTALGLLAMILDMLNLRKIVAKFSTLVLLCLAVYNIATYWNVDQGFYNDMIYINRVSVAFSSLLLVVTGLLAFLADNFFESESHKITDYVSLIIFTLSGALLMLSYGNLVTLFIGLEILSVSLYVLAASNRNNVASTEAGLKYFLMGAFMSGFMLLGITLIYGLTGSFDINKIQELIQGKQADIFLITGVLLLLFTLLFKASIAPFHFWAPDVYTGAPSLVTALLITVSKIAAFGAIFRLLANTLLPSSIVIEPVLVFMIIITFLIASLAGLKQISAKRILAFSGISHAGFLLLAIVATEFTSAGTLFYYATGYVVANIAAFAAIIYVSHVKGSDSLNAFRGLFYVRPGLAIAMTIALLSMAGIPPTAGFVGKYLILLDTIHDQYTYVAILAIITSIISVYYYFKIIMSMSLKSDETHQFTAIPLSYTVVAWICAIGVLVIGLAPKYFTGLF
ncbi:MAG: NADH-quinone oxidoreductase subunit N [Chitinophagales bacterium]|nr:NADH-quinone oxidoreductase subunit N [Chitinophagales bacterium]